ncbi:amylosucrase [Methyloterricola oryzae]|uniref:amylosucrase n=1 Tax=Methyloterricola oryzae TaxID=1495050 RepID=UPI0009E4D0DE|nr:amylosucrase [Methyloterricola oryzae]
MSNAPQFPIRDIAWLNRHAASSLKRLLPRLESRFAAEVDQDEWQGYVHRLQSHFPRLFRCLHELYGDQYDFFYHLESILGTATTLWLARPGELKTLDALRENDPYWYQSQRLLGAMCYVDLFAGNLAGLRERIPYLLELGVNYIHLMPVFRVPEGDNDGGYAVSDYRQLDPRLGTMEELAELASELRRHGISLCLDFVFNHTSDEHEWARRASAGEEDYQQFYRMFPDRSLPDEYERHMSPIFPDEHPGSFTYRNRMRKWVWTSFHNYQWDLNYENPLVFDAMLAEMLFLANRGIEILRLDAVAFIWKRIGTSCQNLPEAHVVIQAYNALARIAAPAMVFKSEAIVHPDEVRKYISGEECQLSYNPQLMALLWDSLATRQVKILKQAMLRRFAIPQGCAWVNYVRCHDDIGFAFSNEDVEAVNLDAAAHRRFLTEFYTGRFKGSFAKGMPFQENPESGDARISGTCTSLAGLESGLEKQDDSEIDLAIQRILLIHGVILTIGGIPLIYLGDEIGMLNDYGYERDPDKIGDTRWLHRAAFDWERAEQRRDAQSIPGRIYQGLLHLIQIRQQYPAFDRAETEIVDSGNDHVFAYFRTSGDHSVLVLANFSETLQRIEGKRLRLLGLRKSVVDLVAGRTIVAAHALEVEPYDFMVLARSTRQS